MPDFGNLKLSHPTAYGTAESSKPSLNKFGDGDIPDSYPNYYLPTSANSLTTCPTYQDDPIVYHQNMENSPFEGLSAGEHMFNEQTAMPNQPINNLSAVYSFPLDHSIVYNRPAFGYSPFVDLSGLPANLPNGQQNVANLNPLNMSLAGPRPSNSSPRNAGRVQNGNSPQYGLSHNFNGHRRSSTGHHSNQFPNNPNNNSNRRPTQKTTNNQANRFPMNQQIHPRSSPNSNYSSAWLFVVQ